MKDLKEVINAIEDLESSSLSNLRSDFTGWNIVEAIEAIAVELKRFNDREEGKK